MSRRPSLLGIYAHLPRKNCDECGFPTCMAFAAAILERKAKLEDCPHISKEDKLKVERLIAAPVAKLMFGTRRPLSIGEARVMHRHELKFYNPTALAAEVTDMHSDTEAVTIIRKVLEIKVERLGETFGIDSIAVTSLSKKPESFARTVKQVSQTTDLPMILNCSEPEALRAGLDACGVERPLIFAATRETLGPYMELAKSYHAPLAVADRDLGELRLMAKQASDNGLEVALYPIVDSLVKALEDQITIRRAAIENNIQEFGHPIIAVPKSLIGKQAGEEELQWRELLVASALAFRYADALILGNASLDTVLPLITLRHGIFSDPKVAAEVKPGLHKIGSPGKDSPVLLTVNYALTFYLVSGDVDKAGVDCYLLVADTDGMSVLNALVGGQLQPRSAAELIQKTDLGSLVSHRKLIIPGLAARLRGELEELSGWEILIGPVESRDLPRFLRGIPK